MELSLLLNSATGRSALSSLAQLAILPRRGGSPGWRNIILAREAATRRPAAARKRGQNWSGAPLKRRSSETSAKSCCSSWSVSGILVCIGLFGQEHSAGDAGANFPVIFKNDFCFHQSAGRVRNRRDEIDLSPKRRRGAA